MRRGLLLVVGLAAAAAAQNTANPQYQLTGKDYRTEAVEIQQMFYNVAGAVKATNAAVTAAGSATAGVSQIVAGSGITVSPAGGTGAVTVNATGGGTTGISSSCAAGFYLSTGTWVNGVAKGGGCVAAPTTLPPNGAAGGDLAGTYPNPTLGATQANVRTVTSSLTVTGAGGVGVTYGLTAGTGTFTSGLAISNITGLCLKTDGSGNVTGVNCASVNTIGYVSDNFLAQTNGSKTGFTLSNVPSLNSERVVLDGVLLSGTSDYSLSGAALTITTAPATACTAAKPVNCTSSFFVQYETGTALASNAAILAATQTFSGANTFTGSFYFSPTTITQNWVFISSSDTTGTNSVSNATQTFILTNFVTDTTSASWRAEWNCAFASATFFYVLFNSDNGPNYGYTSFYNSIAGATFADGGTADKGIDMNADIVIAGPPGVGKGWIEFETAIGNTSNIIFNGQNNFTRSGLQGPVIAGGLYSGSSTPTQINFTQGVANSGTAPNHAGFLRCHIDLYRRGFQHL